MYITLSEIKTHLGDANMTDAQAQILYDQATAILHGLCNIDDFDDEKINERHDYNGNGPYYLKKRPRAENENGHNGTIHSINGTDVDYVEGTEYLLRGRRLLFAPNVTIDTKDSVRNTVEIEYHSGFNGTIPSDFKGAVYALINYVNNTGKATGLNSYSQGDISIDYSKANGISKDEHSIIMGVVGKYGFIDVISI